MITSAAEYDNYKKRSYAFFLAIVAPFFSMIVAFRNYRYSWAKNLVWLFVIFYGYTFVFSNKSLDSDRYVRTLKILYKQNISSFSEFTTLLYSEETNFVDVLQPVLTFIVSRFTDDGKILFGVFGLIFGFFYSRNVWFLLTKVEGHLKNEALPFLILYIFMIAIWQMNGFRFYTAAHVFLYGLLLRFNGKIIQGSILSVVSVFIHFSYVFPVIVLIIYTFFGNRLLVYFLLYIASFFATQLSPSFFQPFSQYLPAVIQERSERYTSDVYIRGTVKAFKENPGNWYVNGRRIALDYGLNFLLLYLVIRNYRNLKSEKGLSLLCFGLLLGSSLNLVSNLPSMIRFFQIFYMVIAGFLFLYCQRKNERIFPRWIHFSFILIITLYVLVEVRIGFQTIGIWTIFGNSLIVPFVENDIAINDLIDAWLK